MVVFQRSEVFFSICNRHCCFVCIFTMIILISIHYIVNSSMTSKFQHCDAMRIQEHYMNNLSVSQLLTRKPIYLDLFEYELVNKDFCGSIMTDIDLLIIIISKSSSYERRNAIRRTYGNLNNVFRHIYDTSTRLEVRLVFLINIDQNRMKNILFEQKIFNDIVQVKIPEEDLMNIYRDLAVLDWSAKYCPHARFIFKMDDTVFLNPFLLIKFINENENDRVNIEVKHPLDINLQCPILDARLPLLYGFVQSNKNVRRQIITREEYPCEIYPDYLNDHVYLMSSDARDLILCTFYRQIDLPLPIPNIYITGILAEYLDIKRQSLVDYQINYHSKIACEIFFTETNPLQAFACIRDEQLTGKVFEQYNIYWQNIIDSQMGNERQ